MTGRRGLAVAVVGCLLGATALLASAGRPWVRSTHRSPAPTAARPDAYLQTTTDHGSGAVAPSVTAFGLVTLAAAAALPATRGRARQGVGALLVVVGALAVVTAARVAADPLPGTVGAATVDLLGAPWLAVAGGALAAATGLLTVVRADKWSALGPAYDAPVRGDVETAPDELWAETD